MQESRRFDGLFSLGVKTCGYMAAEARESV